MRSNLITVVTAVASIVLTAGVATADQVQEQLRLMEQRMAEMEDRLQATSDELSHAQATVCLLYTSPSPRDKRQSRMPSSA